MENDINLGVASSDGTKQYLTFILANEEYAVDILRVQEIRGWDAVTQIPNTPEYMLGVLNLRGAIVPIVDLRLRFGIEKCEFGPTTVIVVLKVCTEDKERTIGIVVDAVSDVCNFEPDEIQDAPDFGSTVDTDFILGIGTQNEKMVILLAIDELLSSGELATNSQEAETV